MSAHVSPSLTTVHLPIGRIGTLAAETLMALVSGRFAETTMLPVELVVRRSTARLG